MRARILVLTLILGGVWACGDDSGTDGDSSVERDGTSTTPDTGDTTDPIVLITSRPDSPTNAETLTYVFTCSEGGCTFFCAVDDGSFAACTSPHVINGLGEGKHTVSIAAEDSAGNRGPAVTDEVIIDLSPPAIISAAFTAYDQLRVEFDEAVPALDAGDLDNYDLTPDRPAGIEVEEVLVETDTVVVLTLSHYVLPIDYQVAATVRDGLGNSGDPATAKLLGQQSRSRMAFVTTASGPGDIDSWDAYTGDPVTRGIMAADVICQESAAAAGLEGTFIAWMSDQTDDAFCRLARLQGKRSADCGEEAVPDPSTGPWIRMDGHPLVATVADASDQRWLVPVRFDQTGALLSASGPGIYTGTHAGKASTPADDCVDWTSAADTDRGMAFGDPLHTLPFRLTNPRSACDGVRNLLCMQTDENGFTWGDGYRRDRKRVFVSSTRFSGKFDRDGKTGLEAADLECQALATAAELDNPDNFVAWLSDDDDDAFCRVLGLSGKKADTCGVTTLPETEGWSRVDDVLVAESVDDLTDGTLLAPLAIDQKGDHQTYNSAWTGTAVDGSARPTHCQGWTQDDAGSSGERGATPMTKSLWSQWGSLTCNNTMALHCFER